MALQVWLPLTKDTRNQGLGSVQTTNNTNFILKSGGKLGTSCLDLSNTVRLYSPNLVNLKTFSFSFWYRPETSESTINWNDVISFNDSKGGFFRLETSYSNSYMLSMHNNTAYGIIQNVTPSYGNTLLLSSASYSRNVWYHIAVTVEENDNVKAYVNGELKCIITRSDGSITGYFNLGELGGNHKEDGGLNDLRIYDHCLSQMEVKELSQGLVLHYLLSDAYVEDTLNYLGAKSDTFTSWGSYGFGSKGIITIDTTQTPVCGGQVAKVTNKTTSTSNSTTEIATTFTSVATTVMEKNEKFTFSAYVKGNDSTIGKACYLHIYNTNGTDTSLKSSSPIILTDKWQRMVYTYTWPYDTASKNNGNCYVYVSMKGGESFYICNAQVEKKDHVTPFTSSSRTTNTVYDTSGFCNNGTISGELSISSDSPKYRAATYFASGNYVLTDTGTFSWFNFDKCTLAAWFKPTTTPTGYSGSIGISHNQNAGHKSFCISNYGGKFTVYSTNGNYVNTRSNTLPINEWHHCAATLDGISLKMYIDGELVKTAELDWGSTGIANDTRFQVGVDLPGTDEMYVGYYSDIRMYATALSADDIKTLYNSNKL